jgi:hypothetical protein
MISKDISSIALPLYSMAVRGHLELMISLHLHAISPGTLDRINIII